MDAHLLNKAQRSIGDGSSKAKSKGSSRKGASRKKKKKSPKTQNAGQSTGPSASAAATSSSSSSRSRSRAAVADEEEAVSPKGGGDGPPAIMGTTKCASYTVGAVHAIDIGLGFALLVYGGMVHVPSVTGAAVTYGLVLVLGAIAGTVGYYYYYSEASSCNKKGLKASSAAGGILVLLDIAAFIAIIVGWDGFIQFLNDNHEALMLSEDQVTSIQGLKILFALIFIVGAGLEAHRCMAMWAMEDAGGGGGGGRAARSPGDSRCSWLLTLCGLQKHKKTDDFVVFDDQASMESSLLWSKNGAQPASDDYLEFVPEHERGLATFASNVGLPKPEADRTDY